MYLDHRECNRTSWKYEYLGSELLESVEKLHAELSEKEIKLRQEMSKCMSDLSSTVTGKAIDELKKNLERTAMTVEECLVWMHEFEQRPNTTYLLTQSDVVFFGYPKKAPVPKPPVPKAIGEYMPPFNKSLTVLENQIIQFMADNVARDTFSIIKHIEGIHGNLYSHHEIFNMIFKLIGNGYLITTVDSRVQHR